MRAERRAMIGGDGLLTWFDQNARQTLHRLARNSEPATQGSIRATDKNTARTVELLGDRIP